MGAWQPLLPAAPHKEGWLGTLGPGYLLGSGRKTHPSSRTPTAIFKEPNHSPPSPSFPHNLGVSEKKTVFPALSSLQEDQVQVSQDVSFPSGSSSSVSEGSFLDLLRTTRLGARVCSQWTGRQPPNALRISVLEFSSSGEAPNKPQVWGSNVWFKGSQRGRESIFDKSRSGPPTGDWALFFFTGLPSVWGTPVCGVKGKLKEPAEPKKRVLWSSSTPCFPP